MATPAATASPVAATHELVAPDDRQAGGVTERGFYMPAPTRRQRCVAPNPYTIVVHNFCVCVGWTHGY